MYHSMLCTALVIHEFVIPAVHCMVEAAAVSSCGRHIGVNDFVLWHGPDSAIHATHGFRSMNQFATTVDGLDEFAATASRLIVGGETDIVMTHKGL